MLTHCNSEVLRLQAYGTGAAVLRSALRSEARKSIGDTGMCEICIRSYSRC